MTIKKGQIEDSYGNILHPQTESSQVLVGNNTLDKVLDGKAQVIHGNHVPTLETTDSSRFLRNDNTWQKVTPENIGALPATSNSVSASKLQTPRTIALSGDVNGSTTFDGSVNAIITTTIANIDGGLF